MALDREALTAALLKRLRDNMTGIEFWTRRFNGWENIPAKPAGVLEKTDEQATSAPGDPTKWRLLFDLAIYYQPSEDPDEPADYQENQFLKAVETALERTNLEQRLAASGFLDTDDPRTTLGGLCAHCFINGTIESGTAGPGGQAVLIVPIEVLATA